MSFVPLTQAVTSGDANAVRASLANGADVNERTGGGQTSLILATIFGHTHLLPILLKAGADPELRDNLGLNAVDWAQRRGSAEALNVLTHKVEPKAETVSRPPAPPLPPRPAPAIEPEVEQAKTVSDDEKSLRWMAGFKQRIAEQSSREIKNEAPEPKPKTVSVPIAENPRVPEPQPKPEPQIKQISEPIRETPPKSSARKRCPKCGATYNSDLLAYCAHHFVPLVDVEDSPIISSPSKPSSAMFWMIVLITLTGSVVVGTLFTTYFYNTNKAAPETAAAQPPKTPVQKGIPVVGRELTGRAVSLPVAECPLNGQEAIPGTVVVKVMIDKNGRVKSAHASGGDWLLRGAAQAAAMKSAFDPQKLHGRETESTITYTFEP